MTTNEDSPIKLYVWLREEWILRGRHRGYRVIFEGPDADRMAAEFISRKTHTHEFEELQLDPIAHPLTLECLYPQRKLAPV